MKKILTAKLTAIQKEIKELENIRLYHLRLDWKILKAKEVLIIEVMKEMESGIRQPLINDIELNYKMGLLTPQERESQLNDIQVKDNY